MRRHKHAITFPPQASPLAGSSGGDNLLIGLDKDIVALKDALEAFKAAIIENGRSATSHRALFVAFRRPEKPMIAGRVLRVAA